MIATTLPDPKVMADLQIQRTVYAGAQRRRLAISRHSLGA